RTTDLANSAAVANNWTIRNGDAITNASNTVAARCEGVVGFGLRGTVITDGVGKVIQVPVIAGGQQFTFSPYVTIRSSNNSTGINALTLTAQNFIAQAKVASTGGAVGNGYSFGVSEGVIYQKGFFIRCPAQTILVDKYDTTPDQVSVGFATVET